MIGDTSIKVGCVVPLQRREVAQRLLAAGVHEVFSQEARICLASDVGRNMKILYAAWPILGFEN